MLIHSLTSRRNSRRAILTTRDALSAGDRRRFSTVIAETFRRHRVFQDHKNFFIYCSVRSEVETTLVQRYCLHAGKTVSVPLTAPEESRLFPVLLTDPENELAPGSFGIPEPIPPVAARARLHPSAIQVAVLPGLVFDRAGNRLGYGGGYYDRFLAHEAPKALRVGLAFSLQVVESLPAQPHDVPLDLLITEQEVLTWRKVTCDGPPYI